MTTWRWTADSFERAGEAGVFGDAHADLIDGEVHVMSPQSPLHAYILDVLTRAVASVPSEYVARVEAPVRLAEDTEPEPDVFVATGPRQRYGRRRHPGPEEVKLIVEVSVSSLDYDAGEKLRTYARYSVPQVWIIDGVHQQVLVHSSPEPGSGAYAHVEVQTAGRLEAFGLEVQVDDLWPED